MKEGIPIKISKETVRRAVRTFVQAALAYIAVNFALVDFTDSRETVRTALIGLAVSATAAGLAAAMNLEGKESNDLE
ncbi:MAG: hypothetical protein IJ168_07500 [Eubacterium sp.]|nr:hypothetical protein [Eubacterium sp.]